MKKVIMSSVCLLLWLFNSANAEPIKVVTEHLPPMQIVEGNKVVGGIAVEVVRLLLNKVGSKTPIVATNWARAYHMAQNQPNVMIFSITRNTEREALFKWVGAVASFNNYLWRLKSRDDIIINRIKEAKRYRTAVPRNDMQHNELERLGFNEEHHLVITSDYNRAVLLVLRGRADLLAGNNLFLQAQLKLHNTDIKTVHPAFKLAPSTLYVAFGLNTDDSLVEKYRQAMIKIKQSEDYAQIMKKWQLNWRAQ